MPSSWGKAPRSVAKPVSMTMLKEHARGYLEHADAGVAEMARHVFRLAHEVEQRQARYLRLESACIKLGNGDAGKSAQAIAREALQHDRRGGV